MHTTLATAAQDLVLRFGLIFGGTMGGLVLYRWHTQIHFSYGRGPFVDPAPVLTAETVVFMAGSTFGLALAARCLLGRLMALADQPPTTDARFGLAVTGSIATSIVLIGVGAALGVATQVAADDTAVHAHGTVQTASR